MLYIHPQPHMLYASNQLHHFSMINPGTSYLSYR
uniref:Uncharacterized protein n=1 Tax=Arundo donax TaxID=35708 RepID=A0A0A9CE23_ARUDO